MEILESIRSGHAIKCSGVPLDQPISLHVICMHVMCVCECKAEEGKARQGEVRDHNVM